MIYVSSAGVTYGVCWCPRLTAPSFIFLCATELAVKSMHEAGAGTDTYDALGLYLCLWMTGYGGA